MRNHYELAVTLKPDLAPAYYNLANLLRVEGKLEESLLRYEQLVALMPRKAEAHNDLANMLMKVGKIDEAIARFQYALSLKPNLAVAHNNLSALLRIKRRFAEAQAHAEKRWPSIPRIRRRTATWRRSCGIKANSTSPWPVSIWPCRSCRPTSKCITIAGR